MNEMNSVNRGSLLLRQEDLNRELASIEAEIRNTGQRLLSLGNALLSMPIHQMRHSVQELGLNYSPQETFDLIASWNRTNAELAQVTDRLG